MRIAYERCALPRDSDSEAARGAEESYVALMREMFNFIDAQGYGVDRLFLDHETACYINIREWASPQQAAAAHRDPRLRAFWRRLAELSETIAIYGQLEEIEIA